MRTVVPSDQSDPDKTIFQSFHISPICEIENFASDTSTPRNAQKSTNLYQQRHIGKCSSWTRAPHTFTTFMTKQVNVKNEKDPSISSDITYPKMLDAFLDDKKQ